MLQNADQSRNEDDRAQNFEEEEGQAFIVHAAEHEVCPFVGKPEEFFKHLGKSFHKTQTNIGVEVLLAWFFLNSDIGLGFVKGFSEMFEKLLGFANEGTNFVFGGMNDKGLTFFLRKNQASRTSMTSS